MKENKIIVDVNGVKFGGDNPPVIIAGPCAVENLTQIVETAEAVKKAGANMLRGGAFKPRTSPTSFQGLGEEGLKYLAIARDLTGLPFVTEIMGVDEIDLVVQYADMLQIGSRNMQNYDLLKKLGEKASDVPILLKRGMCATKDEFVNAAAYLTKFGHNGQIVFCERGIRGTCNADYSRNILDLNLVSDFKETNFLNPIIVDPSHSAGRKDIIAKLSYAAIGAGADGLIIESHIRPKEALCDASQQIFPESLKKIVEKTNQIYQVLK